MFLSFNIVITITNYGEQKITTSIGGWYEDYLGHGIRDWP